MKKILCMLFVILLFTACNSNEVIEAVDDGVASCELAEGITMPEDTDEHDEESVTLPEEPNDEPEPVLDDEFKNDEPIEKDTPLPEPPKTFEQLHENLFYGVGEWVSYGGDEWVSWSAIFGGEINSFPSHLITWGSQRHTGIITSGEFNEWIRQFTSGSLDGWRDHRDSNLLTFINDFNISQEDYIRTLEAESGRSMAEIDAVIAWARAEDTHPLAKNDDGLYADVWRHRMSSSDIAALFSNDVNRLWERFPGSGAMQNGKAYSPEWIMQNVEKAIVEEEIPLEDILRLMGRPPYDEATIQILERIAVVDHAVHEFFFEENNIMLE